MVLVHGITESAAARDPVLVRLGDLLAADQVVRVNGLRRAEHEVVLGSWELLLTQPVEQIAARSATTSIWSIPTDS